MTFRLRLSSKKHAKQRSKLLNTESAALDYSAVNILDEGDAIHLTTINYQGNSEGNSQGSIAPLSLKTFTPLVTDFNHQ